MKAHLLPIALLCLTATACDKVKELAGQARATTEEKVQQVSAQATGKPAPQTTPPVDPKLQALVDQTPEGVVFRKDLPFPSHLEITNIEKITYRNALTFRSSELGRESQRMEGTLSSESTIKRNGGEAIITLGKKILTKPNPEKPEEPFTEVIQDGKAGKSLRLTLHATTWLPDAGADFHGRVWAEEVKGHTSEILIDSGAIPRTLWFSKKRLKIGDAVPLSASHLPVLFDSQGKGNVTLTLQSIEAVNGHPCGVFSVTGDYSCKNSQHVDGSRSDTEMTIQSGKVWLSVLHPLILKKELEVIITLTQSSNGGLSSRTQGGMALSLERIWKAE